MLAGLLRADAAEVPEQDQRRDSRDGGWHTATLAGSAHHSRPLAARRVESSTSDQLQGCASTALMTRSIPEAKWRAIKHNNKTALAAKIKVWRQHWLAQFASTVGTSLS